MRLPPPTEQMYDKIPLKNRPENNVRQDTVQYVTNDGVQVENLDPTGLIRKILLYTYIQVHDVCMCTCAYIHVPVHY